MIWWEEGSEKSSPLRSRSPGKLHCQSCCQNGAKIQGLASINKLKMHVVKSASEDPDAEHLHGKLLTLRSTWVGPVLWGNTQLKLRLTCPPYHAASSVAKSKRKAQCGEGSISKLWFLTGSRCGTALMALPGGTHTKSFAVDCPNPLRVNDGGNLFRDETP